MENQPTIAFVYFVKMTSGEKASLRTQDEKPYAYLNNLGLKQGQYALVHVSGRSDPFAVVEIARNVPMNTRKAAEKITQPLIAPVKFDMERVRKDFGAIKGAKNIIQESRRQSLIDEVLGIDRATNPAGVPALFDDSERGDGVTGE